MLLIMLFLALLPSCRTDDLESFGTADGSDQTYPITVEIDSPESNGNQKSSFTHEDLIRMTDLNIFVYHEGRLMEDYSGYFEDMSSVMLAFPYDRDCFNVYMVGNTGRLEAPLDEAEIANLKYEIEDYSDFRIRGVPVAEIFRSHRKGTQAHFKLKRLVGQYNVMMKNSALDAAYKVKDVRLLNCALDMYPFSADTRAEKFAGKNLSDGREGGDVLTADDIDRLNNGETVCLYFVENLQGELLPGNTDRRKKIPSSLENLESGLSDCCTYIEITADITTPAAQYTDGKYRFYLGQNETTDFSIKRNTLYDVTLDFTQNMISEEEWRIEVDRPQVNALTLSKEEVDLIAGINDYILIEGPRMEINWEESDEDSDDKCEFYLSDIERDGKQYQKLSFRTGRQIRGLYEWGTDYRKVAVKHNVVIESVEKYNGTPLISRNITAYIYDQAFPLFIRMNSNDRSAPYQVEALTDAPVCPGLEISAVAKADVTSSGSTVSYTYRTAASVMGNTVEGLGCCSARFTGLLDRVGEGDGKIVRFRRLDVTVSGKQSDVCSAVDFYMGDGGKACWGPGADLAPQRFADLVTDGGVSANFIHACSVPGCVKYEISSGTTPLFVMAPEGRTCNAVYTTGTSNSLSYSPANFSSGDYLPFYIANGGLKYSAPVTLLDESAKYLDDSARKSIIYEMSGPGRDVFYPNGVRWGTGSENAPGPVHRFGYTAGLVKQFFGNIHTWQIYQDYECDFYMTVNGCTSWPGASSLSSGFNLTYSL